MSTPYDLLFGGGFAQKSAVEALVPGAIGPGPNPGTTGSMDSNPADATNTNIALQRLEQNAAPILATPDADGGMGYSHPAPGHMPSLQMEADVQAAAKAAHIQQLAEQYADAAYIHNMKAAGLEPLPFNQKSAAGTLPSAFGKGFTMHPSGNLASAGMVAEGLGRTVGDSAVNAVRQGGYNAMHAAQATAARAGQAAQEAYHATVNRVGEAAAKAQQYVQNGAEAAHRAATGFASQNPLAAGGIGLGAVAGAGAGGYALAAGQQAHEQAQAIQAKAASVNQEIMEAAQAGAMAALRALGRA